MRINIVQYYKWEKIKELDWPPELARSLMKLYFTEQSTRIDAEHYAEINLRLDTLMTRLTGGENVVLGKYNYSIKEL